ncbi:Uncharacterised protein [Fusobacterium polymorphum]|uniref:Uncharacterized protein n=1 Tax=Fusobacterium polymorphum ATCC 10953 TaxID=393480 RepID=A5TSQ9_FUSNP|nr:hypothetical protein [Fusobacterium polymorphum]EDK87934.1 hypothetical protein FNP_0115 [Fusobacterium polymorphum ATCC 10953]UTI52971.1 hypothetical protein NLJ26_11460 [Fusobacterium polymorphum]WRL67487.1 hypothetical protein VKN78_06530 [Fusobacterium polymorphum]CKH18128.1 Uncharacterised protein [Fusobacterium polymorphum]
MVDFRSILVERMEYKDSILYLYCKTFYKVVENDYYRKYDYNVYHRKVLKFKNVKRFEYYLDEQIYNFVCELNDLQEELGIDYFSKIFYKSKKRNRLYIFERGYFGDFIMIEFKDDEKEKIVIDEKEKYLEIKKELLKILQSKKEKFEEKNIKLEVIEEKEDSYIINLKKVKRIATLLLRIPNSTRYYYIHYKQDFHRYDWYDEEYHTVSEIAKQLNIMLSRF